MQVDAQALALLFFYEFCKISMNIFLKEALLDNHAKSVALSKRKRTSRFQIKQKHSPSEFFWTVVTFSYFCAIKEIFNLISNLVHMKQYKFEAVFLKCSESYLQKLPMKSSVDYNLKGPLPALSQFLTTESPLKRWKILFISC